MLGILADEAALVAAEEMVAANKTMKEVMADEQHIIDVADSDSDDSDGASSDGFPEEEEDPEAAAFQQIDERDQAIMYQHTVDDAVFEATEELCDNDPVLCGAGHYFAPPSGTRRCMAPAVFAPPASGL